MNEYDKAFEAHQNSTAVKDSLLNRDRIQQLEDLRERYETEQRDQTIAMLTLEAETATFRRNTYLFSGILVSLILLLLYSGQRYKTRKYRQLFEKSEEVAQMKSNFFSNISHEFRTPLTLISGPIEKLRSGIDDPGIQKELTIMQKNSDRLLSLINQLLDLSRLESGSLSLGVEKSDLVALNKGVAMSFQSLAEMRQITIKIETDIDTELSNSWVDRNKVETILINLIGNAIKNSPDGGEVLVKISDYEEGDRLRWSKIEISDNGGGIPEPVLEHIFDRFYRGPEKNLSGTAGSGIGLALTKEMVLLHRGEIHVKSSPETGTVFIAELPVSEQHYIDAEKAHTSSNVHKRIPIETEWHLSEDYKVHKINHQSEPASPLLLLIEDNADVMDYLLDILKKSYRIITAADGEAGVKTALQEVPDLVISDVMMPKMNGYEPFAASPKTGCTDRPLRY